MGKSGVIIRKKISETSVKNFKIINEDVEMDTAKTL